MCKIMDQLRRTKSRPVSTSFNSYNQIPKVIEKVGVIMRENNDVVITPHNRQRITESIQTLYRNKF